ncbi:unnamed protein product [Linum tenue]|uniref:Uncharacterized protein n=1 Tax=Linum tenue TaxID=586396 RepID=A0AAV0NDI1_9ROSI|nr:unnamed protein product [Linum tenue]
MPGAQHSDGLERNPRSPHLHLRRLRAEEGRREGGAGGRRQGASTQRGEAPR